MNQTTTRRGKIAQLPSDIRRELNSRLENGAQTEELLLWLNGLPPVKELTKNIFNGVKITAQNLSEWRQGGFRDWQRQQEARELAERWKENSEDLEQVRQCEQISDWLASAAGLQLAAAFEALQDETLDAKDRWERLRPLLHELDRLRRGDHHAARVQVMQARLKNDREELEYTRAERARIRAEEEKKKKRQRMADEMHGLIKVKAAGEEDGAPALAQFGAALIHELEHDLEPRSITKYLEKQVEEEHQEILARQAAKALKAREKEQAKQKAARKQRAAEKQKSAAARSAKLQAARDARKAATGAQTSRSARPVGLQPAREAQKTETLKRHQPAQVSRAAVTTGVPSVPSVPVPQPHATLKAPLPSCTPAIPNAPTTCSTAGSAEPTSADSTQSQLIALNPSSSDTASATAESGPEHSNLTNSNLKTADPVAPESPQQAFASMAREYDRTLRAAMIEAGMIEPEPGEGGVK